MFSGYETSSPRWIIPDTATGRSGWGIDFTALKIKAAGIDRGHLAIQLLKQFMDVRTRPTAISCGT